MSLISKNDSDEASPFIDESILDEMRDLLRGKFPDIIRVYIDDTARRLVAIETAIVHLGDDVGDLVLQAHSVRSSSHYFGAMRLAELAGVLEAIIADASQKSVAIKLVGDVREAFDATQAYLKQYLD